MNFLLITKFIYIESSLPSQFLIVLLFLSFLTSPKPNWCQIEHKAPLSKSGRLKSQQTRILRLPTNLCLIIVWKSKCYTLTSGLNLVIMTLCPSLKSAFKSSRFCTIIEHDVINKNKKFKSATGLSTLKVFFIASTIFYLISILFLFDVS